MRYLYILKYYWMKIQGYRKDDPRTLHDKCVKIDEDPKNWFRVKLDKTICIKNPVWIHPTGYTKT